MTYPSEKEWNYALALQIFNYNVIIVCYYILLLLLFGECFSAPLVLMEHARKRKKSYKFPRNNDHHFCKPNHNSHRNYAQLPNMQTKKLPLQIEVSGIKLVSKIWTNIWSLTDGLVKVETMNGDGNENI